ncbi:ABC transporter ATP-binding protein [Clostridium sardiniense]|uniref:ABC transporter ATP-binding protein n=1 Tax=Clostridium sardiniense TaxID=29369 RepID=UPI001959CB64|nr:ATP-binding cassette domain-containing protein [Clostridium sardiniense]MBM7834493.1 ABC-2 type transport system ATP-binding protein [Clostridium sardiniense]
MIKVQDLTKDFKIRKKDPGFKGALKSLFSNEYDIKKAVSNISFEIEEGEVVGYIGSNGAGKSTTIKMMTGILTPSSGTIEVNGIVPYKDREKNAKDIGVVFGQRTQLWWDLPLTETFTILKDIYSVEDNLFNKNMGFLNEVLGLEEFMNNPVRTLSLGQRMRADLAASLIHSPKILYLDEPTIGLDVVVKDKVREAIKKINREFNTTIILTTHDLSDIEELCERIIIIDNGKKIYDGSLKDIKNSFGYMITLEAQIKGDIKANLNLKEEFNINDIEEYIYDGRLIIKFNKNKVTSSEVIYKVMQKIDILDFSLKETSIEDIIKKIYKKGV